MDNNDLERDRVLPFPNGSPLYILIWASQSAHSKPGGTNCLESVSKLAQGLQSFRSMRRMEASFKNARALRLRFSQSLARRRQRLSHAMVRSTIQRLGNCTNPLA